MKLPDAMEEAPSGMGAPRAHRAPFLTPTFTQSSPSGSCSQLHGVIDWHAAARHQWPMKIANGIPSKSNGTASSSWSPHQVRVLAAMAAVDPRTAAKWLAGHPVTSTCDARLSEAKLRLLGRL